MEYSREIRMRRRSKKRMIRTAAGYGIMVLALLVTAAVVVLAVCGCLYIGEHMGAGAEKRDEYVPADSPHGGEDSETKEPPQTGAVSGSPAEDDPEPQPLPEPYDFGTPLEESGRVDDSFFDTAVFIGDSRTEGLQLFGGLTHGDYLWNRGMSVFHALESDYNVFDIDGEELSLLGALGKKEYASVYVMLGINELGYDVASYEETMGQLIDAIIAAQPRAVVYLETMPPINDEIAVKYNMAYYERTEYVERFNEAIVRVAREKRVALLDVASVYQDADGQLIAELASDGVHFNSIGYPRWAEYLRTHTIDPERYFNERGNTEE